MYVGPWQEYKLYKILVMKQQFQNNNQDPQQITQYSNPALTHNNLSRLPNAQQMNNTTQSHAQANTYKTPNKSCRIPKHPASQKSSQNNIWKSAKIKSSSSANRSLKSKKLSVNPNLNQNNTTVHSSVKMTPTSQLSKKPNSIEAGNRRRMMATSNSNKNVEFDKKREYGSDVNPEFEESRVSIDSFQTLRSLGFVSNSTKFYDTNQRRNQSGIQPTSILKSNFEKWRQFEYMLQFASKMDQEKFFRDFEPPPIENYLSKDVIKKIQKPPLIKHTNRSNSQSTQMSYKDRIAKMRELYGIVASNDRRNTDNEYRPSFNNDSQYLNTRSRKEPSNPESPETQVSTVDSYSGHNELNSKNNRTQKNPLIKLIQKPRNSKDKEESKIQPKCTLPNISAKDSENNVASPFTKKTTLPETLTKEFAFPQFKTKSPFHPTTKELNKSTIKAPSGNQDPKKTISKEDEVFSKLNSNYLAPDHVQEIDGNIQPVYEEIKCENEIPSSRKNNERNTITNSVDESEIDGLIKWANNLPEETSYSMKIIGETEK